MKVESSSFNPIDIAISGMRGQGKRLQDISSNVAGIGKAGGETGSSGAAAELGPANGGITMDDLPQQMINMNSATRAYQANIAVLKRYERMIDTTLELLR
ncbi:MAG: flagellar basal body rod protein FlgC [Planctomycetota bacterium]|jgi:flagellar basal body rod protein FlgC